jgi:hypothetical protein
MATSAIPAIVTPHGLGWLTPAEVAKLYNRARMTIYNWCEDSTLIEFGFKVHQDSRHRWWIKPPADANLPADPFLSPLAPLVEQLEEPVEGTVSIIG